MVTKRKRIGILTGGGDVPGLNSVIKSVVSRGWEHGLEVVGMRRGFEGLTHVDLDDPYSKSRYIVPLDRETTRTIDRSGGTMLHTSRVGPSKVSRLPPHLVNAGVPELPGAHGPSWDLTPQVLKNIERLGIECLICIGGDGTLRSAAQLQAHGVKVIGIPKTMDNDVQGTEYCIGFSTAITRATDAIERQRTTVGSHERIGIFRVFGATTRSWSSPRGPPGTATRSRSTAPPTTTGGGARPAWPRCWPRSSGCAPPRRPSSPT